MAQFTAFWNRQTKSQRITLAVLVIAAAILIPLVVSWATTPSYSVAFSGLDETSAGQIVQQLDADGTPYKLNGTGTILVPANLVYDVRLKMASSGLPASGTVGFEIFDANTFGMTAFTEKVNYQRAMEGELERTIGSLNAVEASQVSIVIPEQALLASEQNPATASVTIKLRSGYSLNLSQVQAITHLVASSIEGLKPESVVIVDTDGNMLSSGSDDGSQSAGLAQADSHFAAEQAAASEIKNKVQAILNSALGPNRSVVQANVVMDWTQRETTSQTYSPTQAAILSSQKSSETYTTNGDTTGGVPGAASNLPTPVATLASGSGSSTYQTSSETTNFQVSSSQSHEVTAPGLITGISLSVLVDGVTDTAQLNTLKSAVAAAAGINTTRGDTLVVDTMAFDRTYLDQQATDMASGEKTDLYYKIGEGVAAALLVIVVLIFISRMMKNLRMSASDSWIPIMKPVSEAALSAPAIQPLIGNGADHSARESHAPPAQVAVPAQNQTPQDEQMQKALSRMTDDNPASVAEIIQIWLNEDEKHHA